MARSIRSFRDLICWQKAIELGVVVYGVTKKLPRDERFGLTMQIRRAVVSVSSNISEGHERQGREYAQFLSYARGSLGEVESQLLFACALGYLKEPDLGSSMSLPTEVRRMVIAITAKLGSK